MRRPLDLRAATLAALAWGTALLGGAAWVPAVSLVVVALALAVRRRRSWPTAAGWSLAVLAVACSTALHAEVSARSPLPGLAAERASVQAVVEVDGTPARLPGRFGDRVAVDGTVVALTVRGRRLALRAPVRLLAGAGDAPVRGSRVEVAGTLRRSGLPGAPAELAVRGPPRLVATPGPLERGAARVRAGIRDAVAHRGRDARALVPALVDGEDGALDRATVEDFRTTGLSHLLAVSGTNLTLMLVFLLALARWCRVRAHGLVVVGVLGVAGFVLLAGPEPSVLRAAAMGTIAVLGTGAGGSRDGTRLLGAGVLALLLVDPALARSAGFALSVLATAGILVLAPGWAEAMGRWLPSWVADAIAVPLAAQVACTPLVALISGSVSLVAVAANLVVAPLVGPATVCGLLGGVLAVPAVPLGALVALPAAWCAEAIVTVAHRGAALTLPAVPWGTGALSLLLLTGLCAVVAVGLHRVLARPAVVCSGCLALAVVIAVPVPTPGWPPRGWVLVACDVGQGDAIVMSAGSGSAVVVDAGPTPDAVDGCLRRLHVRSVPVLVLTHFHADHVAGLAGVLRGRSVGAVVTSSLAEPAAAASQVRAQAGRAGVPVRAAAAGERVTVGPLSWEVLAPEPGSVAASDSPPNDASVVLLADVRGVRVLLAGDQERPSQAVLRRGHPDLRADVLKVAHHGSSKQDDDLVTGLGARLALISVGERNDYGHPALRTLDLLARAGVQVHRTDREGDVAVVVDEDGRLLTVARGRPVGTS